MRSFAKIKSSRKFRKLQNVASLLNHLEIGWSRGHIVRNSIWYTSVKLISINNLLGVFVSCLFKDIFLIVWYTVVVGMKNILKLQRT